MIRFSNRVCLLILPIVLPLLALVGCSRMAATPLTPTPSSMPLPPTPAPSFTPLPPTSAPTFTPLPPTLAPLSLARGPYLQSVTPDGVTIIWETELPLPGQVDYGDTERYGLAASNSTPATRHVVTLTGLKPYSLVHYRISEGKEATVDYTFRTAAAPDHTNFKFVVFGDTRSDPIAHQNVVSSILTLAPDFVLHTGDMVADGLVANDWTTFFSIERKLMSQSPLYGVMGNHEHDSPIYFDVFHFPGNERWYSFDYGNIHFIGLQIDSAGGFQADSEQARWLESDLAQTQQPWKIVFFHVPPHSSGEHGGDERIRDALEPILKKYQVDVVFNGHDHDYERLMTNSIVYIVTGGGGAPLYRQVLTDPASAYFTSTLHSVLVNVDGLQLNLTGVRADGARFDEFTLKKASPTEAAVLVQ